MWCRPTNGFVLYWRNIAPPFKVHSTEGDSIKVCHKHNPSDCVFCPGWCHCFMDLVMAGFQRNLFCHISSSSSHLSLSFLEAALLSGFASSLSSTALFHLVILSVSESQLSHFWIIEPSRVCCCFFPPASPPLLFFLFNFLFFIPRVFLLLLI